MQLPVQPLLDSRSTQPEQPVVFVVVHQVQEYDVSLVDGVEAPDVAR